MRAIHGYTERGFFASRWERATPTEREYTGAMAEDGDGPSQSGEVARRVGKRATSVGPTRAGLIHKGLAYAPEHGLIAFT
ncbi:MAG: ATP-binding protein, partial [Acidimicrobiales bacterium]